jgi:hypothetical protein
MKTYKEFVTEADDWWHPDPEKDRKISGVGNKMRAREDRGQDTSAQTKPDYSRRLKPGESYMDFAKRKSGSSQTKKSSFTDRIKKKLGSAIDRAAGIKK